MKNRKNTLKATIWIVLLLSLWPTRQALAADWALSLSFSGPNPLAEGGRSTLLLVAGIDATAADGIDHRWDLPRFSEEGSIQAHFLPPIGMERPLWNDFRSDQFSGPKRWTVDLNSALGSVTLAWKELSGNGCLDYPFTLTDDTGAVLIALGNTSREGTITVSTPKRLTLEVEMPGSGGGAPPAPSGLFSPFQGKHGGILIWSRPAGEPLKYHLYRSTVRGRDYQRITTVPVDGQAYFENNLSSGTTYYYIVRGINARGCEGPASSEASLKTEGP